MGNFMVVTRARPDANDSDDGHSDDLLSDEELELTRGDLAQALETRVGGQRRSKGGEDAQQEHPDAREAFERAESM